MSLSTASNRVVATGDAVTTVFYFNRLLYDATHLGVYLDGVLQTSGYTVSGVPGTSTYVTFTTAPGASVQVILLRVVPLTQLSVYAVGGAFPAATTEKNFDLVVMALQQFDEINDRSITIPVTDTVSSAATTLPVAADRASKFFAFDVSGNPIASDGSAGTPASAFMATVLDDTTAAAARATLDASKTEPADNVFRVVGSADATKKVAFEVDGLTTGTTRTLTVQDKAGTVAVTSEFDYANLAGSSGRMPLPAMAIQGLTYSNNGSDATNDLDIAAGQCRDATNTHNLLLSALTKQSDVAWAVGTNQGGLDTGAVGNNDYYIWAIKRSDTGVTDVLFSLSSTAPTMPTNYDFKRLIGWFKRVGGTIVAFHTYELSGGGLELIWDAPTLDVNLANTLTTSGRTDAVKVPLNFSTHAHLNVAVRDYAAGVKAWVYCPDQTSAAPSVTVAPLANAVMESGALHTSVQLRIRTNSSGQIGARGSVATVDLYAVSTMGFEWARRN